MAHLDGQGHFVRIRRPRQHRRRQQWVAHGQAEHGGVPKGVKIRRVEAVALPQQLLCQWSDGVAGVERLDMVAVVVVVVVMVMVVVVVVQLVMVVVVVVVVVVMMVVMVTVIMCADGRTNEQTSPLVRYGVWGA